MMGGDKMINLMNSNNFDKAVIEIMKLRNDLNQDSRIEKIESLQRNRVKLNQSLSIATKYQDSTMYDKIIRKLKTIDNTISTLMNA